MLDLFFEKVPFVLFGQGHLLALIIFFVVGLALVLIARCIKSRQTEEIFRKTLAILVALSCIPLNIFSLYHQNWNLQNALPIHLCDSAYFLAIYALWTKKQWAFGLMYYWGLTLSPQALITPFIPYELPHYQAILFWMLHYDVVWAAAVLTWGLGMRPNWKNWRQTIFVTLSYMVFIFGFNALFGTNYLYLNKTPPSPSAIDVMGPWPVYNFVMIFIGIGMWALVTLPWMRKQSAFDYIKSFWTKFRTD
jgi:hypothetical integral membrane protein (TIGR02206 family)